MATRNGNTNNDVIRLFRKSSNRVGPYRPHDGYAANAHPKDLADDDAIDAIACQGHERCGCHSVDLHSNGLVTQSECHIRGTLCVPLPRSRPFPFDPMPLVRFPKTDGIPRSYQSFHRRKQTVEEERSHSINRREPRPERRQFPLVESRPRAFSYKGFAQCGCLKVDPACFVVPAACYPSVGNGASTDELPMLG